MTGRQNLEEKVKGSFEKTKTGVEKGMQKAKEDFDSSVLKTRESIDTSVQKVKEGIDSGVQKGRYGIENGTGVKNFGTRGKHFFNEIVPDAIYAGEMVLENVIYTAAAGHMPPPEVELGMIAGTKILNDYFVGELWWKNRKEKLNGKNVFKNYMKTDFVPDMIETGLLSGGAYLAMGDPALYNAGAAESFAEGARDVAVWGGELGAGALGAEAFTAFGIPFVGWLWNSVGKVFKWYDSKITGMKYNTPAPPGEPKGTAS